LSTGLADYAKAYKGKRFAGVGPVGTEASDHWLCSPHFSQQYL
jgi:hypothetical protein